MDEVGGKFRIQLIMESMMKGLLTRSCESGNRQSDERYDDRFAPWINHGLNIEDVGDHCNYFNGSINQMNYQGDTSVSDHCNCFNGLVNLVNYLDDTSGSSRGQKIVKVRIG